MVDKKGIAGFGAKDSEQVAEPKRLDNVGSFDAEPKHKYHNVFDEIMQTGHDEDFVPSVTDEFCPTDAPAGSAAKVQVLADRVRKGLPLWHPEDRVTYLGLTGAAFRSRD